MKANQKKIVNKINQYTSRIQIKAQQISINHNHKKHKTQPNREIPQKQISMEGRNKRTTTRDNFRTEG